MTPILDKVRKLLRLSESPNANEATSAAAMAQRLIDEHQLSTAMLALDDATPTDGLDDEPIKDFGDSPLDAPKRLDLWRSQLAMSIAHYNACKVYRCGHQLKIIGRPTDSDTVRYVYGWLVREVERLATQDGRGQGQTWRNNYRLGVVETIARKLRDQRAEFEASVLATATEESSAGNSQALVRVHRGLVAVAERRTTVDRWAKANMKLRAGASGRSAFNPSARMAGRIAGQSINVAGSRTKLTSAAKGLPAGGRY